MIGTLLGVFLAFQLIAVAWSGGLSFASLVPVGVMFLIGLLLFPRTIGIAFMWVLLAGIPALIVALLRGGWGQAGMTLLLCLTVGAASAVLGAVRRDAV